MALRAFLALAAFLSASCSSPEDGAERSGESEGDTGVSAEAGGSAAVAEPREIKVENDLYVFEQKWPREVSAVPALAERLGANGDAAKQRLIDQAQEDRASARANEYPYRAHGYGEEWKVVAEIPGYLSLSNAFYAYSGGAHGNYGMRSLIWDTAAGAGVAGSTLFDSPATLQRALGDKLCNALDAERLRRRGSDYEFHEGDLFDDCPGLDEATILVGSSDGEAFDRIGVYFGPYVAGPYAEGAYELDFPVDTKVLDTVKPEFRAAFALAR